MDARAGKRGRPACGGLTHDGLCRDELWQLFADSFDLGPGPRAVPDGLLRCQHLFGARKHGEEAQWELLIGRVLDVLESDGLLCCDVGKILGAQLALNRLEVSHRVHAVVDMHDALSLKGANDVNQSIDPLDVREEGVSESGTLARTPDKTSNVRDIKKSGVLGGRLPELYKCLVARVRHSDTSSRRVDLVLHRIARRGQQETPPLPPAQPSD